ncbi:MAG: UDP-3-O-acyl-N-acetylglucosamine deacetylase [Thermodesulfovibrionales bacterium]
MRFQKTIRKELLFEGTGLHTGEHVTMRLRPAPKDSGVVFYRSDKGAYINASITSISDTAFAMTLGSNGTRIKTVEHILAAVSGLGIDNLVIEVDGPEVPILDGSSAGFVEKILDAGIVRQDSQRLYARVIKPLVFKNGHSEIAAFPYEGRRFTCRIHFDHKFLGSQELSIELEEGSFARELAPARTFGFLENVESLRAAGLAKGGSLENAVILSDEGVLNSTGLRFEDEFVRHKMLDFIGDISLIGFPIFGHIVASRSGHSANLGFVRKFLDSPDCWEIASEADHSLQAPVPS